MNFLANPILGNNSITQSLPFSAPGVPSSSSLLLWALYPPAALALFQFLQYVKVISISQPLHMMPLFVRYSSVHPSHAGSSEYFQAQLKFFFFNVLFILFYLFIFGYVGSLLLHAGFL